MYIQHCLGSTLRYHFIEKIIVRPCSTSLFDLVRRLVRTSLVRPCSTPLFEPCSDFVCNRLFLYDHTFLQPCSTLVRPLVRRPCSTLFDRLFDILVQSLPGPTKSEHSAAEIPFSIACSLPIVLQRYLVWRLFGFFLDVFPWDTVYICILVVLRIYIYIY